jgi:hypothetical protein
MKEKQHQRSVDKWGAVVWLSRTISTFYTKFASSHCYYFTANSLRKETIFWPGWLSSIMRHGQHPKLVTSWILQTNILNW